MKKPMFEAEFELTGQTKQFYTFEIRNASKPHDFYPLKIYISQISCKELKGKFVKLSITEKEK